MSQYLQKIAVSAETYALLRKMCGSLVEYGDIAPSETAIILRGKTEEANVLVVPHGNDGGPFETLFERLAGYTPKVEG